MSMPCLRKIIILKGSASIWFDVESDVFPWIWVGCLCKVQTHHQSKFALENDNITQQFKVYLELYIKYSTFVLVWMQGLQGVKWIQERRRTARTDQISFWQDFEIAPLMISSWLKVCPWTIVILILLLIIIIIHCHHHHHHHHCPTSKVLVGVHACRPHFAFSAGIKKPVSSASSSSFSLTNH